jgi:hypothetical protein
VHAPSAIQNNSEKKQSEVFHGKREAVSHIKLLASPAMSHQVIKTAQKFFQSAHGYVHVKTGYVVPVGLSCRFP